MATTYMFEPWLDEVRTMLDFSISDTAIFLGCLVTLFLIAVVLIATRGQGGAVVPLVTGLFSVLMFTIMAWFPTWMGGVLAFLLAVVTAWYISQAGG